MPEEKRHEEIKQLSKQKKSLKKQIHRHNRKIKKSKEKIHQIGERKDLGYEIDMMVNNDGLFRTNDIRYIQNGLLQQSIQSIGMMLNHAKPNYRKIASMTESVIGHLSLCNCDYMSIDGKMIELLSNYILEHKKILECINPIAVVLYAKFLILSQLDDVSIVFNCDQILHCQKFSNAYRRISEGKYAFDQYVEFSKFQNRFMTQEQRWIFSQYQKIIRVMEDQGMVTCESGKMKQKTRNFIRDMGIHRDQIGELLHYSYDKALDAAHRYYEEKDPNLEPLFGYIRDISNFSPSYAGERYAMASF